MSTHLIEILPNTVTKRFRSWSRGEPAREWRALELLARYAPGLAPSPLDADLDADPPVVVMSRLPGEPLDRAPVGPDQLRELVHVVERLHRAVPPTLLADLPAASPVELAAKARRQRAERRASVPDSLVREAFEAGSVWLDSASLRDTLAAEVSPVLGQGDGNLANFMWDGTRVRLLDFEDSGRSDHAYELAELVEHLGSGVGGALDSEAFLTGFALTRSERARVRDLRRLCAFQWLLMLLPGGSAHTRNPPDTLAQQANRLLSLLGSG